MDFYVTSRVFKRKLNDIFINHFSERKSAPTPAIGLLVFHWRCLICCCERVPIFVGATPTTFNWHPTTFFVLLLFVAQTRTFLSRCCFLLFSRFSWKSVHLFDGVSFAVAFDITRRIWNNCSPILFFLNLKLVPKQMDQKSWKNHFQKWITTSETRNSICCLRNATWHSGWNFECVISNNL